MTAQRPTLADLWCDAKARDAIQGSALWTAIWTAVGYLAPSLPHWVPPLFLAGLGVCVWVIATRYQALTDDADNTVDVTVETPALPAPETDTYTPTTPDAERWW